MQVDAASNLTRKFGGKRSYNGRSRKRKATAPPKVYKKLVSIESIIDGTAFDPSFDPSQDATPSENIEECTVSNCCTMQCNEQWDAEALERTRARLPRYGPGTQAARKTFVRESFTEANGQLHLRDGLNTLPVCWGFFAKLHGVSCNLLSSAASIGPTGM